MSLYTDEESSNFCSVPSDDRNTKRRQCRRIRVVRAAVFVVSTRNKSITTLIIVALANAAVPRRMQSGM